jgi:hypothetical protein
VRRTNRGMIGSRRTFAMLVAGSFWVGIYSGSDVAWAVDDDSANNSLYQGLRIVGAGPGGSDYVLTDYNTGRGDRCRRVPPACGRHEDAYVQGFREAIAGRRYGAPIPLRLRGWGMGGAGDNPNQPSRRSCQGLADLDRTCCQMGYRYGIPALQRHIRNLRGRESGRIDNASDRDCLANYETGVQLARRFCAAARNEGAHCPAAPARQSHLGCFHIGFQDTLQSTCANEVWAEGKEDFWVRYSHPSSATSVLPGQPDQPAIGSSTSEPSSGRVRAGEAAVGSPVPASGHGGTP